MGKRRSGQGMSRDAPGFTLLEALVSMSLFAVILITILLVYDSTQKTYVRGEAKADLQQNVRVALDLIMHDVRLAGYDPSNAIAGQTTAAKRYPFPPLADATTLVNPATELRLIGDMDGDGTTDCVAYRVNSGQILRAKGNWSSGDCAWGSAESTVADSITTLNFTFYPATGTTATTNPAQVKRVKIAITASSNTYETTFTAESEVVLRQ